MIIDPKELTAQLIKCPSVTPKDCGALEVIELILTKYNFVCQRINRNGVHNLFARWGNINNGPTLCFSGHTDVVSPGDFSSWSIDPFGAVERNGVLYGRGACDMKSAVASFVSAAIEVSQNDNLAGSIVLAITGDEEGKAKDGTLAILDWIKKHNEKIDHCLVGEPTCRDKLGDMIKIGRRGSLNIKFKAKGKQGHVAYPDKANNPLIAINSLMNRLLESPLDAGNLHFDPSTLVFTSIDTENTATNIIPSDCTAQVNIRFNNLHEGYSLVKWIEKIGVKVSEETNVSLKILSQISGEPFLTNVNFFCELITNVIKSETGIDPILSTSGGTSDARFIKDFCPVIEFGLVGNTMHQVDECTSIADIYKLTNIYQQIILQYFNTLS